MKNLRKMTTVCLCSTLMVLCAWLTIPFAIPFTLQVLGVYFALFYLGGKWGTIAISLYLAIGAVGMPVFSSFRGGFAHFLSPTGGFLWGFLLAGLLFWMLKKVPSLLKAGLGQLVCYLCGMTWYAVQTATSLKVAFLLCVAPFILFDAMKIALAFFLAKRLGRLASS